MSYDINNLEDYYVTKHKNKIFCTKLCIHGKECHILYNYEKKQEIDNFVSNFTEYLPYYVYNADTLECIDATGNISDKLLEISKQCWEGPNIPSRLVQVNGIFGELFLDFYERIVKKSKLASTYASRRDFNNNNENRGFDNVLFRLNDNTVEFVFAEAKFVTDKGNATTALIKDIKGTPASANKSAEMGHLTKEYMNDYITFVIEKNSFFSDDDKRILKPFISEMNDVLLNHKGDFISHLINKGTRINCVFFAIFKDSSTNPEDFIDKYDQIHKEAEAHLEAIGFTNYSIEIVFIPTSAKSMEIKGAIDGYYKKN